MKNLEREIKNKVLEKKKSYFGSIKQANEQQVILRTHFERNLILEMEKKTKIKQSKILFNYYILKDCLTHLKKKTESLNLT